MGELSKRNGGDIVTFGAKAFRRMPFPCVLLFNHVVHHSLYVAFVIITYHCPNCVRIVRTPNSRHSEEHTHADLFQFKFETV